MKLIKQLLIVFLGLLSISAVAQVIIHEQYRQNIRISCFDLEGLQKRLRRVTNEMQVYNNDQRTWHSKDGCAITIDRPYADNPHDARQAGASISRASSIGFMGWLVTDDWLLPVNRIFYTDNNYVAYIPTGIYSRKDYFLLPYCMKRSTKEQGIKIFGHQFTAGNPADNLARTYCRDPMVGELKDYSGLPGFDSKRCNCDCDK